MGNGCAETALHKPADTGDSMIVGEILWVIMSYVIGSIPFGILIAKTFCKIDPRQAGSKSSGATNVSRLCGFRYGVATLLCDVAKGALPVLGAWLMDSDPVFVSFTGLACVVGHVFSCFLHFHGGKGVATSIGVFIPLAFFPLLGSCALCMLVIWRSGFVSLGSLTLFGSLPFLLAFVGLWRWLPLSLALAFVIFVKHRENIARLRAGTEKPWLKHKHDNIAEK